MVWGSFLVCPVPDTYLLCIEWLNTFKNRQSKWKIHDILMVTTVPKGTGFQLMLYWVFKYFIWSGAVSKIGIWRKILEYAVLSGSTQWDKDKLSSPKPLHKLEAEFLSLTSCTKASVQRLLDIKFRISTVAFIIPCHQVKWASIISSVDSPLDLLHCPIVCYFSH